MSMERFIGFDCEIVEAHSGPFLWASFYCFSAEQSILVYPQSQYFVLGHWTNVKQLVCVSELLTFSPWCTSSVRAVALCYNLFPWARCPRAWTGLTQIGMNTSQKREICIPLWEVQTSWGAKQSMRAHTPTVQWADLELQSGGWWFFKKIYLFKAKHLD